MRDLEIVNDRKHVKNIAYTGVAYRKGHRFRSDTGLKSRYPMNNLVFIKSDRIVETPISIR